MRPRKPRVLICKSQRPFEILEPRKHFSVGTYYVAADSTAGYSDIWVNATNPGVGTPTFRVATTNANYEMYFTGAQPTGTTGEQVTINATNGNPLPSDGLYISCLSSTAANNQLVVGGTGSGGDTYKYNGTVVTFDSTPITSTNTNNVDLVPIEGGTDSMTITSGTAYLPGFSSGGIHTRYFSTLNISSGATLIATNLSPSSASNHAVRQLLVVSSGGLSVGGTLDLGGNDMVVRSGGLSTINALVASASAYPHGEGIETSETESYPLTTLGVASEGVYGSTTFDGITIGSSDIIIKYTYFGDANLSGTVDGADYSIEDNGEANHLTGWDNGDFNYDGVIDGTDYSLMDNAFNNQPFAL